MPQLDGSFCSISDTAPAVLAIRLYAVACLSQEILSIMWQRATDWPMCMPNASHTHDCRRNKILQLKTRLSALHSWDTKSGQKLVQHRKNTNAKEVFSLFLNLVFVAFYYSQADSSLMAQRTRASRRWITNVRKSTETAYSAVITGSTRATAKLQMSSR